MRHLALLSFALLLPIPSRGGGEGFDSNDAHPASLFEQSAVQTLNRNFPDSEISFLLLDARNGQVLASRWEEPDKPIPLGSLTKPFAALAYGEHHQFVYPVHTCAGTITGCWRPGGHGRMDLTSAIAYSCNSYFRMLTVELTAPDVALIATRYGLDTPDRDTSGAALAGLGPQWRISPLRMARAYLELAEERENPVVRQILKGMADSAQHGTGAEVDRALHSTRALVKTGTAACTHSPHAPGDGFTVALFPEDDPKILLMVRVHGIPGAQAAKIAGQMLQRIGD
jgi:cell division protein FtsI/penicillin-binding protein 2